MQDRLKELSREKLQKIILDITEFLTKEQYQRLQMMVDELSAEPLECKKTPLPARMSHEFVDEKLEKMKGWMKQIDEGELYLDAEEYEDYSGGGSLSVFFISCVS